MKKTIIILGMGVFLFSCNEYTEASDSEPKDTNETNTEVNDTEMDSETMVEETETESDSAVMVSLEDRTYKVEEFVELYNENKEGLKEQSITIEGYYMNHNKQKDANADDEAYEYNVTLYTDETFDRDASQVFFMMKSKKEDQFEGIKQKDKITVTGKISGDEFFNAPLLEEGAIVK